MAGTQVQVKRTDCFQCWYQCAVKVEVRDGQVVRVGPEREESTGRGSGRSALCVKSGAALDFHNHPNRLNYPLKRVGRRGEDRWERIPWQQAMDEIAENLGAIRSSHGPESVVALGGTIHGPGDAMAWRWCNLFGTPNMIWQGKNCGEAQQLSDCAVLGYSARGHIVPGVTRCVLLWGSNPTDSSPNHNWVALQSAKAKGAQVIVVDPRRTKSADLADLWLQIRPGTDGALGLAMLHVMVNEGLYDRQFVADWCLGFEEIRDLVQEYPPEKVADITWLPAEKIVEAARMYATLKPSFLSWGVSDCQIGGKAVQSAVLTKSILRALVGTLDEPGSNYFSSSPDRLQWTKNMYWDRQFDHPLRKRDNLGAEQWPIASARGYRLFREAMGKVYPGGLGHAQYQMFVSSRAIWRGILEEKPYPVKGVIMQGSNALLTLGDARTTYQALKSPKLDVHVHMDFFMTPTAMLADYVLPAADWMERPNLWDTWGFGDVVQGGEQSVEPMHERHCDYDLWRDLGVRLGQEGYWPESLEAMYDELLSGTGVTFKELLSRPGRSLPPARREPGRYRETGFATFSGKVELVPSIFQKLGYDPLPRYEEPPRSPVSTPELAEEYPLVLISGSRVVTYLHSCYREEPKLRRLYPEPRLEIHPETAAGLGIADGDIVYIETPEGRVRQKARVTDRIHPRVVHADGYWWYPELPGKDPCLFGLWDSNINAITPGGVECFDYAGDNAFRALLCRVYKAKEF